MTDTEEMWRAVPGYEKTYEVSDRGRVRSLPRIMQTARGPWSYPGRVMRQNTDPSGRKRVGLRFLGHERNYKVHTLVLLAFVGPRPEGMEGCHNNGDPSDNRLTNLRWDTHRGNEADKLRHGTHHQRNKTHCKRGHQLVAPNLKPNQPGRACKSCGRASDARRWGKHRHDDPQQLSDAFYAQLMEDSCAPSKCSPLTPSRAASER